MTSQLRPETDAALCSPTGTGQTLTSAGELNSEPNSSTIEAVKETDDSDSLNTECAVCMHFNSDTVIYDCGHCCLCYSCAHDLLRLKHQCPICRRPIKDVIKVFYG